MAKRGNNSLGRRSYGGKPYDANNSFVKKMANKVGDLMPQRSWISKWFNTSDDNGEVDNENGENSEEEVQPPANKRPRIRMDVMHPPGTFSIHGRGGESSDDNGSRKDQFSHANDTGEDFLEPSAAGPSGVRRFVSSTPAVTANSRNSNSQRSELNSLIPSQNNRAQNNRTSNGADDNSESSESTSGCSSLIPQTNRQEAPTSSGYNTNLAGRKRMIDDKLSFTNHLQSPRSLFLESGSRESLSSRRPSFNASMMSNNTFDRSSSLSSPFYTGNVTFGGANALSHYKPNRSLFNSDYQLKIPRRTSVQVKPTNAESIDSSGMSQTAKRILEAMEYFSSPITDAKKIPLMSTTTTTTTTTTATASGRKRMRDESFHGATSRVGLRHLTRELSVPTVPDILKLRRRQKLQDTTMAARKIVSAMSGPPVASTTFANNVRPIDQYHLPIKHDDNPKFHGKLRTKLKDNSSSVNNEAPWNVNLPLIELPITSLPHFDPLPNYPTASAIENLESRFSDNSDVFKFASPIKIHEAAWNLTSINNFSFSKPLNPTYGKDNNRSPKTMSVKSNYKSNDVSAVSMAAGTNFAWTSSSTAPRLKVKTKSNANKTSELKTGSVMDILGKKICGNDRGFEFTDTNDKPTSDIWECNDCYIKNDENKKICVACKASRPTATIDEKTTSANVSGSMKQPERASDGFDGKFKINNEQWKCLSCLVKNSANEVTCVSCRTPKNDEKTTSANSLITTTTTITKNSSLMEKFKPAEGSWECPGCMLRNPSSVITCPCCKAAKPSSLKISPNKTTTTPKIETTENKSSTIVDSANSFDMANKFKPSATSWECDSCMVRNNETADKCVCCANPKPGTTTKTIEETTKSTEKIVYTSGWGDQFKKPEGTWSCESCMVQNKSDVTECVACGGLKPGATAKSSSTTFSFGTTAKLPNITFGIPNQKTNASDKPTNSNGFTFGVKTTKTDNESTTKTFTFGVPKTTEPIAKTVENATKSTPFVFAAPKSADDDNNTGFKFDNNANAKSSITENNDGKIAPTFSFGLPKTIDEKPKDTDDKKTFGNVESNGKPCFAFGATKTEVRETDVEKSGPKMTFGITSNDLSSSKPSDSKDTLKSTVSWSKSATATSEQSSSTSTTFTAPNPSIQTPSSTIPTQNRVTFGFGDAKPKTTSETTSPSCFGQTTVPPAATTFSMTSAKTVDSATSFGVTSTPSTTSQQSEIQTDANKSNSTIFGNVEKKSFFDVLASNNSDNNNASSGFSGPDKKTTSMFGTTENKLPTGFGGTDKSSSSTMFNSSTTSFGAPVRSTTSLPPVFGNNSGGGVFGGGPMTNFGTPNSGPAAATANVDANNIFAAAKSPATSNNATTGLFTFGASGSQPAAASAAAASSTAATGGFNFTGNSGNTGAASKSLFSFGGGAAATAAAAPVVGLQSGGEGFGSGASMTGGMFGANNPVNNNATGSPFTFNAPVKQDPPSFGQATAGGVANMFGAQQAAPSIGQPQPTQQQTASTGFNFGGAAAAPAAGVFSFGGGMSQPANAPSTGFNFNAPSASPSIAFDPNTRPTFNFTGGSAPTAFNATPQQPATARKFKKAVRRMPQR